jgi:hypothetical protein
MYAYHFHLEFHSTSVQILDGRLGPNIMITDYEIFFCRAQDLLNFLAAEFMPIPEKLAVTDVFLLSQHPVKYNRLSNIYHGQYKNTNGEQVEIALKVLGIFAERSEEQQEELWHHRFIQEALVWHDLKHRNIEPFFGVDSTTFPHPARVMVSQWMAQGSVLEYIAKNSPVAQYAAELVRLSVYLGAASGASIQLYSD